MPGVVSLDQLPNNINSKSMLIRVIAVRRLELWNGLHFLLLTDP